MSTKSLTPSQEVGMTDGQIDKIVDNVRAGLRKRRHDFKTDDVQQALTSGQLDKRIITATGTALEKAIAQVADTITKTVEVNRDLTQQQVLDATKRAQYTDKSVVATMPTGGSGIEKNIPVEFFKLGCYVSDDELAREYEKRGLTPDPYAQAAVNEADPAFADEHPNGTHWKDVNGNWCCATFDRSDDERSVYVYRDGSDWNDYWWCGGVRK